MEFKCRVCSGAGAEVLLGHSAVVLRMVMINVDCLPLKIRKQYLLIGGEL